MSPTVRGLAEIVLWTRDPERSLSFYRDLLGLELISPGDLPPKFLKCGEGPDGVPEMIVLVPHPENRDFPRQKSERVLHHVAFNVDPGRYGSLRSQCEASGLEVRDGVHPVLKDVRTFYIDDPDGNEVEIISPA